MKNKQRAEEEVNALYRARYEADEKDKAVECSSLDTCYNYAT